MTRKPRSTYPDRTRAIRAARRQAILDAAARRMGEKSWIAIETKIRQAMESAETDSEANERLVEAIGNMFHKTPIGGNDGSPADMIRIMEKYPLGTSGRPPKEKPEE